MCFLTVTAQFDVTRPFYVVVEAPGSAFRGEQLGVQIALYNYWSQSLEVISTRISTSHNPLR